MLNLLLYLFYILIGLSLLITGANYFIKYILLLGQKLKIPELIMGIIIVSFGGALPEILIAITSAMHNNSVLAIGNAYGSSVTNFALIIGIIPFITRINVARKFLFFEIPLILLASCITLVSLYMWGIPRITSVILFILLGIFLVKVLLDTKRNTSNFKTLPKENKPSLNLYKLFIFIGISFTVLSFGANLLVKNAVNIAHTFKLSDFIIGITIISIGTSLPEIVANIIAARKGRPNLIIGNIIGSSTLNIIVVVGLATVINPLLPHLIRNYGEIYFFLGQVSFLALLLLLYRAKSIIIHKSIAAIYLVSYLLYILYIIFY